MTTQSFRLDMKDYSPQVLKAMKEQVQKGLKSIGMEAEGYAKKECPVDTGRLRNSIAWAVTDESGNSGRAMQPGDDEPKANPKKSTLYIGTNVKYAPNMEFHDMEHKVGRAHFIRDAISTHGDQYKEIMKAALKT